MAEVSLKSAPHRFRFDRFSLDTSNRRLCRDHEPIELSSRYFDALALLVREQGNLVTKDRFLDEVWRGVPVTDEALTQCVKALRRALGDEVANPRFIETVPKHGYRFIAAVERDGANRVAAPEPDSRVEGWRETLLLGAAGTIGAGMAGFFGGLIYGFAGASQGAAAGVGGLSVLLVILCVCIAVALIGGAGVAFGIAVAGRLGPGQWWAKIAGGAVGGLLVGAAVKLLGLDAFTLLLGHAPRGITGALEGAVLGAGVGLGAWLAGTRAAAGSLRRSLGFGALSGAAAGLVIALAGGRLMAGNLDLLARTFPDSRLHLDQLGAIVGEHGFGPLAALITSILEGALFSALLVGATALARRNLGLVSPRNEAE